ncbi:MAG: hypothetical protein WA802_16670 [Terracidiphilus sp.]
MKFLKLLVMAIFACASLPLMMAQQVNTQTQESTSGSAAGSHANQSANAGASANANPGHVEANGSASSSLSAAGRGPASASAIGGGDASGSAQMRPVTGELEGKLDSKTAKPGDRIVLKTDKKMQTADGTLIPKGSRLVGHVTEVQAHEKDHAESQLGLAFDHAELKDGQSMAIHSMIESVQPSAGAIAGGSMANEDALDAPMASGGGGMGAGARGGGRVGGGGLLGGAVGGATQTTGRVGSDLGSTTGGAVRTTSNLSGDATGDLAHGVSGATQGAGSLGARATGLPGVMLNGDAAGSASGMLSAANKNVHLDSGTQMVLGISAAR